MKSRRFGLMISALVLAAQLGSPAAAEPSLEQLSRLEQFLEENDVQGLRNYVERHPELLDGGTPLAELLNEFMDASTEVTDYLGWQPVQPDDNVDLSQIAPGGDAPSADDEIY